MTTPCIGRALAAFTFASAALLAQAADKGAPPTARKPVTDVYGDIRVTDPYRWLEKSGDPSVRQWGFAQDRRTRAYIDKLPTRKPMFDWLMQQAAGSSSAFYDLHATPGRLFALYSQPPKQQPMLAVLGQDADPARARVILDPNVLNPKGTTAIDWYVPAPTGNLVAVSMSEDGSEDGSLHLVDVATGKVVDQVIPNVQYATGGGSLAWREDGAGFWYTRYPGAGEPAERQHFYQQIYYHRVGDDPAKDAYVLGKDFPRVAEIALDARPGTSAVVATVANGDGGEFAHYLLGQDGSIRQVTRFEDKVVGAALGPDALYLISRQGAARGKLLKLGLDDLTLDHATTLVAESDAVLEPSGEFGASSITITKNALYLREVAGGPSRVAVYGLDGRPRGLLPLPEVAAVDEVELLDDGSLMVAVKTYLEPAQFVRVDPAGGNSAPTLLRRTSPVSFDDVEVLREFATSKDGTRIPLNIVRRKGLKLDGTAPLLLTGYGGYNISMVPQFLGASIRMWLDAGGVYVIANLRGGGEFGELWHAQGALANKQNVFDDFAAAARFVVDKGYSRPERMAAIGGSNGGLLMGAVITQNPAMFRAVVSTVGIYDMLRVELDPNGAFNVTEYGSVRDAQQLQALYSYSPYHHVRDGAKYPAIFMATGETDGRVNPMHSRKMIARLQAATGSGRPVLLSIDAHAGHGMGSSLSRRISQTADMYAFLFDQLGMRYPVERRSCQACGTRLEPVSMGACLSATRSAELQAERVVPVDDGSSCRD